MDFETKLWDVRVAFPTFCVAFQRRPCIVRGIVFHARCFFVVTGPAVSSQVFFSDQPFVYPCFRVSVQTRGGVRHLHLPTACRACVHPPLGWFVCARVWRRGLNRGGGQPTLRAPRPHALRRRRSVIHRRALADAGLADRRGVALRCAPYALALPRALRRENENKVG